MTPVVLENFSVTVDTAEVRRYLGSKDRKRPAPGERYDDVLNEMLRAGEGLIAPKGIYTYTTGREL